MASSGLKVLSVENLRLRFYFNKMQPAAAAAPAAPVDRTRLKEAIKSNHTGKVLELLHSGLDADLPVDSTWDHTPLILATCFGAHRVIPLLLRVCQKKDATNYEGHTALDKGIIYYGLACQHFQHKPFEIDKRYDILRALVRAGCQKVKVPEIELWIKENKRDSRFVRGLVEVFCLSPSYDLKCVGLATLLRLNIDLNYIQQILTSGAGFKYLKMIMSPLKQYIFEFPEAISDMLAEVLIKATNNQFIHRQVINIKTKEARKGKGSFLLKERLLDLLSQVDTPVALSLPGSPQNVTHISEALLRLSQPKDLKHLCRGKIRDSLRPNVLFGAKYLPLPPKLKDFITLDSPAL